MNIGSDNNEGTDSKSVHTEENSVEELKDTSVEMDGNSNEMTETEISRARKREMKRFIISFGLVLILGLALHFMTPIIEKAQTYYMLGPRQIVRLFLLPMLWLVIGWTVAQSAFAFGLVKTVKAKASRPIHIAMLVVILLFIAIMLPYTVDLVKIMAMELRYHGNPSLYPDGIHYLSQIPPFLFRIELALMDTVYSQPALFIIPSMLFRLSQTERRK